MGSSTNNILAQDSPLRRNWGILLSILPSHPAFNLYCCWFAIRYPDIRPQCALRGIPRRLHCHTTRILLQPELKCRHFLSITLHREYQRFGSKVAQIRSTIGVSDPFFIRFSRTQCSCPRQDRPLQHLPLLLSICTTTSTFEDYPHTPIATTGIPSLRGVRSPPTPNTRAPCIDSKRLFNAHNLP